jgi:hypothetical protein
VAKTNTSDRECQDHTTCDFNKEWESTEAGTHNDRVCTPLTFCNFDSQWESTAKTTQSNRLCSPLTVCPAGQHVVTPKTQTSDRVCGACADGFFKLTENTDDFCTPCPSGMTSRGHRRSCKVQACSHLTCKHEQHTCFFGRHQSWRGGEQSHADFDYNGHDSKFQLQCDGRVFQSIRVYHAGEETNCRDGHKCGMGVVSGDKTKCECKSIEPVTAPKEQTRESVVPRAIMGMQTATAAIQALDLHAATHTCLSAGDVSTFTVAYRAGNAQPADALGFRLQYDPRFFTLRSAVAAPNAHCPHATTGLPSDTLTANQQTFVSYACASPTGQGIVPPQADAALTVELVAKGGYSGVTEVSVHADSQVAATGFQYMAAAPMRLRYGHCEP